ncbi:MAG: hypothetical protein UV53_C0006G0025 [Candidatus Azambacteria bacterium GW2011_GWE1_42_9]|nr:MAG: hypothetical protein UU33_C0001G0024 [Candidatus Azambacteria bacterium GW2011_GWF1_41_10]KKS49203.1 MAG: hypothetical protein UV14_C0002G0200 [Candidatus Azambacteria bacterium GW2011_GWF2_42_22]KKS74583.1 MAG: hypothetical protein UV45_C0001G0020 [Candidatus Azambacteria bacterium GW2011_GWB1_42_72]KKS79482.1 MAG: hypothetical protein UV53_C0006G0025 [Candidatus Azambacteria bacterium GW2011_GWE1_42_9]KKT03089.1 MAG: hypothetical protein UV81_C0004G0026 [Candidatus Azambacteria bacter
MKNKILYISIMAIFFVGFFYFWYSTHQPMPASTTVKLEIEEFEIARLMPSFDEWELKILTNEYFNSRNFIFLDNKTGEIVTTLSITNPARGTPDYRIIKGSKHDWLVVTKMVTWGTGMQIDNDEWYVLGRSGEMKMVMSYQSRTLGVPGESGKNEYGRTDIMNEGYPDDSAVDIKTTEKICSVAKDGSDKDCSESSHIYHYVWNADKEEFALE